MSRQPAVSTDVFAQKKSRFETKADATTTVARSIIAAEAKAQASKTERLRALRLAADEAAQEAQEAAPAAPPKRAAKKKAAAK